MTTQVASTPPRLFSTLRTLQLRGSTRQLIRVSSWVGRLALTLLLTLAIFPNAIAPYDSTERVAPPLQKPNKENILGTNDLGQDLFSELIAAATRAAGPTHY
jgi:ABC-type dipeptide/oligopeptide/nickel transport system permease subunit